MRNQLNHTLNKSITDALSFIEHSQLSGGNFLHVTSDDPHTEKKTIFVTALILTILGQGHRGSEIATIRTIATKGIAFLFDEKNLNQPSWNYWSKEAKDTIGQAKIPDDLDDTFTALAAISLHSNADGTFFTGKTMADIVDMLLRTEEKTGGPYNTWLTLKEGAWRDIDPIVNANIAYFLSLKDIQLPAVNEYIIATIKNILDARATDGGTDLPRISRYYFSPVTMLYFLCRPYKSDPIADRIKNFLLEKLETTAADKKLNLLETSMAISMLLRFDTDTDTITPFVQSLMEAQVENAWKPHALYIETSPQNTPSYAGSAALTAAFYVEALLAYKNATTQAIVPSNLDDTENTLEKEIIARFTARFEQFPSIKSFVPNILKKVTSIDPGKQITLLPYFFNKSLAVALDDREYIIELGVTNLAGWVAYRIFDDIFDAGTFTHLLPLGAMCLRYITEKYTLIFEKCAIKNVKNGQKSFPLLFKNMMDQMDEANAREKRYISTPLSIPEYGNYETLSHKSLPHCLGPIAILAQSRCEYIEADDPAITETISFFHHYLIARQLHDDAHDWYDDLTHGFVNSVAAKILKNETISSDISANISSNKLPKDLLHSIFWNEVAPEIVKDITRHTALAEKALETLEKKKILASTTYLQSLLDPLKKSALDTLSERATMLDFLRAYARYPFSSATHVTQMPTAPACTSP